LLIPRDVRDSLALVFSQVIILVVIDDTLHDDAYSEMCVYIVILREERERERER